MKVRVLLSAQELDITLNRLSHQLIENHNNFFDSVIIALQPRGMHVAQRIVQKLTDKGIPPPPLGALDITFFRDDFRRREEPLSANQTSIDFLVEGKKVIFVDDVLYTGRSVRAALDAINSFGRPAQVELLVLIDRRLSRHLPIQPDYVGRVVDSVASEKVVVRWKGKDQNDSVELISANHHE